MQDSLNNKFGCCGFVNGKYTPCDYHLSKVNNSVFKLSDSSSNISFGESNQITHTPTPNMIKMSELFNNPGREPAGGWYLVQEQREWLESRLRKIFVSEINKEIYLLVAGVASYVHFYTFIKIVLDISKEVDFPLKKLYVDVIDKCIFPLDQIASIERVIRIKKKRIPKSIKIHGMKVGIHIDKRILIDSICSDLRLINVRLMQRDLKYVDDFDKRGSYSIVCEHFLTSLFRKLPELVNATRTTYKELLKEGGNLIIATGIKDTDYDSKLKSLHIRNGFKLIDEKKVWDPYGMDYEYIKSIASDRESKISVAQDNRLMHYIKR